MPEWQSAAVSGFFLYSDAGFCFCDIFKTLSLIEQSTYFDGAYISTSPSLGSAIHVAKKRNADTILVMKITPGKGKGAYIDKISEKKGKELEFLVGRFEKYRVESFKQNIFIDGKPYYIIVVGDSR